MFTDTRVMGLRQELLTYAQTVGDFMIWSDPNWRFASAAWLLRGS